MEQIIRELTLIGIVGAVTLAAYFFVRKPGNSAAQNAEGVLTGLIGSFILLGGVAKFFDPFTTMFANQIALSNLPLPTLSKIAGQGGEITAGLLLLVLFFFGNRFSRVLRDRVFYFANLLIAGIMAVAVYVHLHPAVPAETLPFQSKPPVVTLIIMALAGLNIWLHRKNTLHPVMA